MTNYIKISMKFQLLSWIPYLPIEIIIASSEASSEIPRFTLSKLRNL